MSQLKERVKAVLVNYPETQENNKTFMARIWSEDTAINTSKDVLRDLAQDNLTSWDSATRAKRKLQEEHPQLRGQSYAKRKNKAKKAAKDLDSTLF